MAKSPGLPGGRGEGVHGGKVGLYIEGTHIFDDRLFLLLCESSSAWHIL